MDDKGSIYILYLVIFNMHGGGRDVYVLNMCVCMCMRMHIHLVGHIRILVCGLILCM